MPPFNSNPYAAPTSGDSVDAFATRGRYVGRAVIAMLLAAAIVATAVLTGGLWMLGAIDLGRFGWIFLGALLLASVFLFFAAKNYRSGSRRTAVGLATIAPCLIGLAILLALNDAGVIALF